MGSNYFDFENVIGKKYNNLKVISVFYDSKRGRKKLLCECDCGNEISIEPYRLKLTKSCGRCNLKSFEQWCIDNNHRNYLDLWDYDLNDKKPSEISHGVKYGAYFKCPKGIHESKQKHIFVVTRDESISCIECSSFGQWCINNDLQEWIELWDYELNDVTPFEIGHTSHNKYYFKCLRCLHESELKDICTLTRFKYLKCSKCNSIGQWISDNLSVESINEYWDYDKNTEKPFEINYGSQTKIWIKCHEVITHPSYIIETNRFTSGTKCPICASKKVIKGINDIATTHPELAKYFSNIEESYKHTYCSDKKVLMMCPNCSHEKLRIISKLYYYGFCCEKCSDNISYPEKFTFELLRQLSINFQCQLNKKQFAWCEKYKYDFYFEHNNESYIIETHGMQHYEYGFNSYYLGKTTQEEQENDRLKLEIALNNTIKHYIILDCRYSDREWIKNSTLNSELPYLLNFKEEDIDWEKCEKQALSSRVLEACKLWNDGVRNVKSIGEIIGIHFSNVTGYLKRCSRLGLCDYDPKVEQAKGLKNLVSPKKQVRVIEDDRIFESMTFLDKHSIDLYGVHFKRSSISEVCNGRKKSHKGYHFEIVND